MSCAELICATSKDALLRRRPAKSTIDGDAFSALSAPPRDAVDTEITSR